MKLYFMWYNSASHKRSRFYTGTELIKMSQQVAPGIIATAQGEKPTWSYDKQDAHVDVLEEMTKAKEFANLCGYEGLVLEPIDEFKMFVPPIQETVQ
jgi:hypothetical protein